MSLITISLENMEFHAFHGCYDLEKVVGNRFLVTLDVQVETGAAAEHDELSGTVNYLNLYACVKRQMEIPSDILENVAHRILETVRAEFPAVLKSSVSVSKIAPPLGGKIDRVSVRMER